MKAISEKMSETEKKNILWKILYGNSEDEDDDDKREAFDAIFDFISVSELFIYFLNTNSSEDVFDYIAGPINEEIKKIEREILKQKEKINKKKEKPATYTDEDRDEDLDNLDALKTKINELKDQKSEFNMGKREKRQILNLIYQKILTLKHTSK